MGLRPSRCYHWDSPAYTRVANNPSDSFITGIPGNKIVHYDMGNTKGRYNTVASVMAKSRIQVRHNALESARIITQKFLERELGVVNYWFKVRVYPHHVMRENAMATGAGADRVQDGMRRSFGKPMGRAARVNANQKILSVYFNDVGENIVKVKNALKRAVSKLPGDLSIVVEPNPIKASA